MGFYRFYTVFMLFFVICHSANSQTTESTPTNATKAVSKESNHKNEEQSCQDKPETESKQFLPILDHRTQPDEPSSTLKPKITRMPPNIILNTKKQPTVTPIIINTATTKPAHYVRLRDPERKKLNVDTNSANKATPNKVYPKDMIRPKSTQNRKKDSKNITYRQHKPHSNIYIEDDSLPPARKSRTKKVKHGNKNDLQNKAKENQIKTDSDDDAVHYENGTHSIVITKLPEHETEKTEPEHEIQKAAEHDLRKAEPEHEIQKAAEHEIRKAEPEHEIHKTEYKEPNEVNFHKTSLIIPSKELEIPIPKTEHLDLALHINRETSQSTYKHDDGNLKDYKIDTTVKDDSNDIITISNHNYEEVEERGGAVWPEQTNWNENISQQWANPQWPNQALPNNPYNYLQNYQAAYDQYLKNVADYYPGLYRRGNCYPRSQFPNFFADNGLEYSQTYSDPSQNQVQEIIYGQKSNPNIIDIRPENALGRIWKTWKDSEIKISKPNVMNRLGKYGRNLNEFKPMKKPAYEPQVQTQGFNGYNYNNLHGLNNAYLNPYNNMYTPYRYNMK